MKKFLPSLVLLLVLGAGAAALYLFQRQGRSGEMAGAAAELLPSDTQLLLSIPDLNGTVRQWQTSDLYKIWSEPEVQAFLARPLSKLPAHAQFTKTFAKVSRLNPTRIFLALVPGDEKAAEPRVLAGFDFEGNKAAVEELLSDSKEALRQKYPAGKADLVEYQGHAVETFDDGGGSLVLASAYLDGRYLVSTDMTVLKSAIDRNDHRSPAGTAKETLGQEAEFRTVLAQLPSQYATLLFARPQPALNRLSDLAAASGQPLDESRRVALQKLKALGATTKIENGKFRDTLYVLAPGLADEERLKLSATPMTAPGTLLFATAMTELPAQMDIPSGPMPAGTPVSGLLMGLQELATMLHDHGVTLERFRAAFGKEFSLQLDWPPDRSQPMVLLSVDVRDTGLAAKVVDNLTGAASAEVLWQPTLADGLTFYTLSGGSNGYINPTFTLTGKHLLIGLNPPEVREAAQREKNGGANIAGSAGYKAALASVAAPNASFVYLDSPAFCERLYGTLRGFAVFGALFYPQINEYIDVTKLPVTKTLSKHLTPTVFTQKNDERGSLLESVGSVTVGQAGFTLVAGAAATAYPMIQSQLGTVTGAGAATPATGVVSPTPSESPALSPKSQGNENQ